MVEVWRRTETSGEALSALTESWGVFEGGATLPPGMHRPSNWVPNEVLRAARRAKALPFQFPDQARCRLQAVWSISADAIDLGKESRSLHTPLGAQGLR